jgi:hypothetical protein
MTINLSQCHKCASGLVYYNIYIQGTDAVLDMRKEVRTEINTEKI